MQGEMRECIGLDTCIGVKRKHQWHGDCLVRTEMPTAIHVKLYTKVVNVDCHTISRTHSVSKSVLYLIFIVASN